MEPIYGDIIACALYVFDFLAEPTLKNRLKKGKIEELMIDSR